MSQMGVSNIVNSPLFQDELARRRADQDSIQDEGHAKNLTRVRDVIEDNALKAAETQVSLLENENPAIQLQTSKEILNRTFGGPTLGEGGQKKASVVIQGDQINLLLTAISESGKDPRLELLNEPT